MRPPAALKSFLDEEAIPLQLWLAPRAWQAFERPLRERLGDQAELLAVPPPEPADDPEGPAVLLLTEADLAGPHRPRLLALCERADPGRPIIHGGARNAETVLESINTWHAFRVLPADSPIKVLAGTARKAHEALALEQAMDRAVDEMHYECRRLNGAIQELQATQQRLLHAERLATVGRITGPLMSRVEQQFASLDAFEASLKLLRQDQRLFGLLEATTDGVRSVSTLLRDMLALTTNRAVEVCAREEELDGLVQRAVSFLQHDSGLRQRILRQSYDSGARVLLDRYRTYLVLMNFLRNAVDATEPRDLIQIRTRREGQQAIIEVEDTGCGMTPEVRRQLFTPFFTTKGSEGTGLGLRLSKTAIERQGGTLECQSAPGQGTCFRISMPVVS